VTKNLKLEDYLTKIEFNPAKASNNNQTLVNFLKNQINGAK